MVAVLYHSRSLCCFSPAYDVGPQLRRHNIADSEVPLSLGCCRRSAARCVGQRAVPGPDLHCALPALSLSVCITAASIRTHCTTWPPHLHMASRTCTWPTHPTSTYAPLPHPTYPAESARRIQRTQKNTRTPAKIIQLPPTRRLAQKPVRGCAHPRGGNYVVGGICGGLSRGARVRGVWCVWCASGTREVRGASGTTPRVRRADKMRRDTSRRLCE